MRNIAQTMLASSLLATSTALTRIPDFAVARHVQGRRLDNIHRSIAAGTSIAQANRRTGRPHEHRREIARRLRQAGGAA